MNDVLALVSSLKSDVQRLSNRIDDFEKRQGFADLDRVLNLKETARAIGKSPSTVRHWVADAALFDRHQLAALFRKDVSNRWTSSPRLVARWRQVALRALQEVCR